MSDAPTSVPVSLFRLHGASGILLVIRNLECSFRSHRIRYYMHSSDPQFEAKLVDVVGLYLDPPENGVVLCVDEKTGIQALDRTQPQLPLRPGQVTRLSVEYKRNGVVSLFAALQVHSGTVHGQVENRRTHVESPSFLRQFN